MDKYLLPNYEIIVNPALAMARAISSKLGYKDAPILWLNLTAAKILSMIQGDKTWEEICKEIPMLQKDEFQKNAYNVIETAISRGFISLSDNPDKRSVLVKNSSRHPGMFRATLEVTSNCNLSCAHCYGKYSSENPTYVDVDKLLPALDECIERGLFQLELSGGECTIHPRLNDILSYAIERIHFVRLLTNGFNIGENVFEVHSSASKPNSLTVQVTFHGDEAAHDSFVGVRSAFQRGLKSLERFSRAGANTVAAYMVSPMNEHFALKFMEMCHDMGITEFRFSVSDTSLGRAKNLSKCSREFSCQSEFGDSDAEYDPYIVQSLQSYSRLLKQIETIETKFPNFLNDPNINKNKGSIIGNIEGKCTAGIRSMYIKVNGDVCLCPLSSSEKECITFGNLFRNTYADVFFTDQSRRFVELPSPNEMDCGKCEKLVSCKQCIFRAVKYSQKFGAACTWGTNNNIAEFLA